MKNILSLSMLFLAGFHLSCSAGERFVELGGCRIKLDESFSCLDLEKSKGMLCNAFDQGRAISLTFYPVSYAESLGSRPSVSSEEIGAGNQKIMRYSYDLSGEGDLVDIFVIEGTERVLEINAEKSFALRMAASCK